MAWWFSHEWPSFHSLSAESWKRRHKNNESQRWSHLHVCNVWWNYLWLYKTGSVLLWRLQEYGHWHIGKMNFYPLLFVVKIYMKSTEIFYSTAHFTSTTWTWKCVVLSLKWTSMWRNFIPKWNDRASWTTYPNSSSIWPNTLHYGNQYGQINNRQSSWRERKWSALLLFHWWQGMLDYQFIVTEQESGGWYVPWPAKSISLQCRYFLPGSISIWFRKNRSHWLWGERANQIDGSPKAIAPISLLPESIGGGNTHIAAALWFLAWIRLRWRVQHCISMQAADGGLYRPPALRLLQWLWPWLWPGTSFRCWWEACGCCSLQIEGWSGPEGAGNFAGTISVWGSAFRRLPTYSSSLHLRLSPKPHRCCSCVSECGVNSRSGAEHPTVQLPATCAYPSKQYGSRHSNRQNAHPQAPALISHQFGNGIYKREYRIFRFVPGLWTSTFMLQLLQPGHTSHCSSMTATFSNLFRV